ncbi:FtsX-like permease family protein [Thermomonas sp.]|uniref:ABC transporter permease n=1 Tax=Thermomonas sp. TaxID=1971895 RepID=UPI002487AFD7|nr:FtsX-like permease family protein [Thermomonas sp.]MDI1253538.1 FtsX-like permease family protein [Thermomonas sp.]
MKVGKLAWRQLRRDLASGDIRILLAALVLAVIAVTAVGFVTDRAARALTQEANRLLGGDIVLRSDQPLPPALAEAARANGLRMSETRDLTSMLRIGSGSSERLELGEVRALGVGYPLRGEFRIDTGDGIERIASGIPPAGSAWLSRAGADRLGAHIGDVVALGESRFRIAALVLQEPDAGVDYFSVAPKLFVPLDALAATGLVQEGSRLRYRLAVAGDAPALSRFSSEVTAANVRGLRVETASDARPEIASALDRAGRFLGLAALVSVMLAAVAVAMAARRHSERNLQAAAVMRCLGASQRTLVAIHVGELVLLGLLACSIGIAIAFLLQWGVGAWLATQLGVGIPAAAWQPAAEGLAVGMLVLLAFGAPPVLALRRVPALRVLRRDLDPTEPSAWLAAVTGLGGLAALLWWKAGSATLGFAMLAGIAATLAVLALMAWLLILLLRRLRSRLRGPLRYGLANVSRRAGTSIAQVSALGLGLMALLLLTFVQRDLLDRWQRTLAADAPNRFIINVQAEQLKPLAEFIKSNGLVAPELFPMVRARYIARNGREVPKGQYAESGQRAQALAEREFNLSTTSTLQPDNRITAGEFWPADGPAQTEISVEEGFANTLGWKLGDRIGFDIAGQRLDARITSLRKVEWENFRPNFFVVVSPGALKGYPASHITALHVPPAKSRFTAELVARFPNVSVIDVDAVLKQVRSTADQVATVVRVVFWFSFAAGVLVLLAAVSASQDERLHEGAVMRVIGGRGRQLRLAQASEFAALGLISGLVAAVAASILSGVVATRVFNLPWEPDWVMAAVGGSLGMAAALAAGMWATRGVLNSPPSVILRGS